MDQPRTFIAVTDTARVIVVAAPTPNGLDCAVTLNGTRCRSLYELDGIEATCKRLVAAQYGVVREWVRGGTRVSTVGKRVMALDIDGVLNSFAFMARNRATWCNASLVTMLDPAACARLERILVATGATILVSSACRVSDTCAEIEAALRACGAPSAVVIGATPPSWLDSKRGHEIQRWLDAHGPVETLAIVAYKQPISRAQVAAIRPAKFLAGEDGGFGLEVGRKRVGGGGHGQDGLSAYSA